MELEIFIPTTEEEISRCWELMQRSNQLHLNGNRYSREEFDGLLRNYQCYGLHCKDKFGDYGIIGFCRLDGRIIKDLVISCRIAQRKVEQTLFDYLRKDDELYVEYIKTERNKPMFTLLNELGKPENDSIFKIVPMAFKPIMKIYEKKG